MLKSWFIGTGFLIVIWLLYYFNILQWFGSSYAIVIGLLFVIGSLIAAFIILGNPFKDQRK